MKKFIALLLGIIIALGHSAYSDNNHLINVVVNNDVLVFDINPSVIEGRTIVPSKFITIDYTASYSADSEMADYQPLVVDGGDLSGKRDANVVVNIGFGDRKYYSYTNEYGQVIKVTAKEIVLQDESTEPTLSNGRYYADEANVPGVESPTLDKGHIIM